jgi:acetyltransferase
LTEQTRVYTALRGVRGRPPVDLAALEQLLVRFSQLVVEQPRVKELDINPLLAAPGPADGASGLLALDARVVLHGADVADDALPRPAIRPYPAQYAVPWTLRDGTAVLIRPIRPEDEPAMVRFHRTLSERSVYYRYFHALSLSQRVAHERLTRICFVDYDRDLALVVDRTDPATGEHEILGVGRMSKARGANEAEFAILVSDQYQRHGLGTELLRRLVDAARAERLDRLVADILPDNYAMQRVCQRLGFAVRFDTEEDVVKATLVL